MKKGKSVKVGIVIALLLLVVGYATVTAVLNINGTAKLKGNQSEFDANLRFVMDTDEAKHATIALSIDSSATDQGEVSVGPKGKTLTFETPVLDVVGETATVTYWVENRGQYDAEFTEIKCTPSADNASLLDYIEVVPSTNYQGLKLAAARDGVATQAEEASTITVRLKKTYASDEEAKITITCSLKAKALEN